MSTADVTMYLMTLSATATAAFALTSSGAWRLSKALSAFIVMSTISDATLVAWPDLRTPEFWTAREAVFAVLCAVSALEFGHGVLHPALRVWRAVCWRVMALFCLLTCVGIFGLASSAGGARVGYRGLLMVEAALVVLFALTLSAVSLYELPRHPLVVTALRGLLRYSAFELVYIGSWEASPRIASALAWPTTLVFVWAMLAITREAFSHPLLAKTTSEVTQ